MELTPKGFKDTLRALHRNVFHKNSLKRFSFKCCLHMYLKENLLKVYMQALIFFVSCGKYFMRCGVLMRLEKLHIDMSIYFSKNRNFRMFK